MWWTPAPALASPGSPAAASHPAAAATTRFVTRAALVFRAGGGTGTAVPPYKPPSKPVFGEYCFKATCRILDGAGQEVGHARGYDTELTVGDATERACKLETRSMRSSGRGQYSCAGAEVVMLPNSDEQCSGQVFFTVGTSTRRLV
jgi:hypothetical protein